MTETSKSAAPKVPLELVEWRVDSAPFDRDGKTVCRYIPYIDAATIAELLDGWVGPGRWSDVYVPGDINGKYVLWCHLSVKFDDEWVTRRDVGLPSDMQPEKGCVSDAFKRAACLKYGVGRNVYDLPTLWAVCRVDKKGKAVPLDQNNATTNDLIRQLEARGFEASGARVPEGGDDTTDTTTPAPTVDAADAAPVVLVDPSWGSQAERDAKWTELKDATAQRGTDDVRKALRELAFKKGTFTTAHAEQWERLLPPPIDRAALVDNISDFARAATGTALEEYEAFLKEHDIGFPGDPIGDMTDAQLDLVWAWLQQPKETT